MGLILQYRIIDEWSIFNRYLCMILNGGGVQLIDRLIYY